MKLDTLAELLANRIALPVRAIERPDHAKIVDAHGSTIALTTQPELIKAALNNLPAIIDALREETCPICDGHEMQSGEFCIAGCRDGKVRWTSANVLRSVKPWMDADRRAISEQRAEIKRLRDALRKLEAAATLVTEWLDRVNDRDGTALGGPQWFELGRSIASARAALNPTGQPA